MVTAGTTFARSSTNRFARFDLLVQTCPGQILGHRLPPGHRSGGKVRIECSPVVALLGWVHLEEPGPGRLRVARDVDPQIPLAIAPHIPVVGQQRRVAGQLEDLLVTARHPVPTVGLGPPYGALRLHLVGDFGKPFGVVLLWRSKCTGVFLSPTDPIKRSSSFWSAIGH